MDKHKNVQKKMVRSVELLNTEVRKLTACHEVTVSSGYDRDTLIARHREMIDAMDDRIRDLECIVTKVCSDRDNLQNEIERLRGQVQWLTSKYND